MAISFTHATIGGRITSARALRGATQSALAKTLKLTRSSISQWELGDTEPSKENLLKIADALQVDFEWLATGRGSGPGSEGVSPGEQDTRPATGRGIRELDTRAGMGGGGALESEVRHDGTHADPLKPDEWFFPSAFMRDVLRAPAARLLVLEVQGDSMLPTIHSGERVIIDTGHATPSPDGVYALRDRFDMIVVKRLQVRRNEPKIRIISDNPAHQVEEVGIDEVAVVGRVVCCMRRL